MNKRMTGVLAALLLAALGTFVIVRYVGSAEARALEGQETLEVLVVTAPVAAGTPAGDLAGRVEAVLIPAKVQAPGSIASLDEISGNVAAVDLVPGEQVLSTRFIAVEEFAALDEFDVPEGLVEVTLSLSADRAVGGELNPGDIVSVFSSFEPMELGWIEPTGLTFEEFVDRAFALVNVETQGDNGEGLIPGDEGVINVSLGSGDPDDLSAENGPLGVGFKSPYVTHTILHKILVTNIKVERLPAPGDETSAEDAGVELAPTGNLLVTLAMDPVAAERIVFTAEYGGVWLGAESATAAEDGTDLQNRATIFEDEEAGVTP